MYVELIQELGIYKHIFNSHLVNEHLLFHLIYQIELVLTPRLTIYKHFNAS